MGINHLLKRITDGAIQHGEDSGEPEHTLGDLEDALYLALQLIPREQLDAYAELPEIKTIIDGGIDPRDQ